LNTAIFEKFKEKSQKKKVQSLCNKLIKKCSFGSGADCENLCHLSYWLYIYGEEELAMECVALTHDVSFKHDYAVWTFIHAMRGLEIRILRSRGEGARADLIAKQIDTQLLTPTKLIPTEEGRAKKEGKRRLRFTYENAIRKEEIENHVNEGNKIRANAWRLVALLGMIGDTETGLYPLLNEARADIEEKIQEYISELALVK
jgi:hypothetical protein